MMLTQVQAEPLTLVHSALTEKIRPAVLAETVIQSRQPEAVRAHQTLADSPRTTALVALAVGRAAARGPGILARPAMRERREAGRRQLAVLMAAGFRNVVRRVPTAASRKALAVVVVATALQKVVRVAAGAVVAAVLGAPVAWVAERALRFSSSIQRLR